MYLVESCGTTIEITSSHKAAWDCFNSAQGPEVKMFYRDSRGALTILHHKINKVLLGNSKVKKQAGSDQKLDTKIDSIEYKKDTKLAA